MVMTDKDKLVVSEVMEWLEDMGREIERISRKADCHPQLVLEFMVRMANELRSDMIKKYKKEGIDIYEEAGITTGTTEENTESNGEG